MSEDYKFKNTNCLREKKTSSTFRTPLTWPAYSVDVGDPSLWTRADHSTYGYGIENVATSVLQARLNHWTGIDALLTDAHQFIRAVDVDSAFGLLDLIHEMSFAVGEGIS